ncbi:MAG: FAD-dependent oxidoreductase [Ruminiclostridium sp.]|nr:FAD-dependent oxidoreductase [Ruminiclostridium sp.]
MIRYSNITAPLEFNDGWLRLWLALKMKISVSDIKDITLVKKSVDARKKSDICFVLSVNISVKNETDVLKKNKNNKNISYIKKEKYLLPQTATLPKRPVVVGFGPAGMFAALYLAQSGVKPIVLERGLDVDSRTSKVRLFWEKGELDTECNVQFGEGGAGTFSDGKLNTGVNNPLSKIVFNELVKHGAPAEILYEAKPHIGTDKLSETVKNIRKDIISMGGEVIFGARYIDYKEKDGKLCAVIYEKEGKEFIIDTDNMILATGHSARDVFYSLNNKGVILTPKNFSVGVRIEHTQEELNKSMYGEFYNHPALGAADYKIAVHDNNGRGIYSFCMCPGGTVVASSSEKNTIVTNGMSMFRRDGANANSAILVGVTPEDFGNNPLDGIAFQEKIEKAAFTAAGNRYIAPCCKVGDFLSGKETDLSGTVTPSYKPGVKLVLPDRYLPSFVCDALKFALPEFGKKISCFKNPDALLTGPETRSSSPVRILRNDKLYIDRIKGLYPAGEGAGYAGGIVTAAMDGIKCAMAVLER